MKVENRTIVITDPCYITPNDLWDDEIDCFSGNGIENYGVSDYIWEGTIYGDWSCTTLKMEKTSPYSPEEVFEKLTSDEEVSSLIMDNKNKLGTFCADAGLVGVFYLDEILKFNPKFLEKVKKFPEGYTIIENFTGEVEYYVVNDCATIIGIGSEFDFITYQSGF